MKISADMSDSVKQKKLSHFPLFFRGFSFHMQGISDWWFLLFVEGSCTIPWTHYCQWIH